MLSPHRVGFVAATVFAVGIVCQTAAGAESDGLKIVNTGHEVHVVDGNRPVATFDPDCHGKPVLASIRTPAGHRVTRGYPMMPPQTHEKTDHQHHRGVWFTHGDINGADFWADDHGDADIKVLTIDVAAQGDAVIETTNAWIGGDNAVLMTDRRRWRFTRDGDRHVVDFSITATAPDNADAIWGDTKEGTFGMRVAGSMKMDAGLGGQLVNADGIVGKAAWGKRSAWADYSGPVNDDSAANDSGATVGVTIHDHPSNLNYPARWHARTYGLFAINPFGVHHFVGGDPTQGHRLPAGESLTLRYRMVIHDGPHDSQISAQDHQRFAAE